MATATAWKGCTKERGRLKPFSCASHWRARRATAGPFVFRHRRRRL